MNSNLKKWILKHWGSKYNLTDSILKELKANNTHPNLPYSYNDLYQLYLLKDLLKQDFNLIKDEIENNSLPSIEAIEEITQTKSQHHIGSITLEQIGKELQMTIAGVKQIEDSAKQKLNFFAIKDKQDNLSDFDIDEDEWSNNLHRAITTYISFFDISKKESNINEFLSNLEIAGYITKNELKLILNLEKEVHEYLHDKLFTGSVELARAFIEEDIMEDESMLKSFQNVLAKTWNERTGFVKEKKRKKTIDDF